MLRNVMRQKQDRYKMSVRKVQKTASRQALGLADDSAWTAQGEWPID
jgi:hypothetical protein